MHKEYFIALGGNVGDTKAIFENVVEMLNTEIGEVLKISSIYRSRPLPTTNPNKQGSYLNAVLLLKTALNPEDLLRNIQEIEETLGRERENYVHWGPRTIDLDIISAGSLLLETPILTIPHPRFSERDFVLVPIKEIDPNFKHPQSKLSIDQLIDNLPKENHFIESKVT